MLWVGQHSSRHVFNVLCNERSSTAVLISSLLICCISILAFQDLVPAGTFPLKAAQVMLSPSNILRAASKPKVAFVHLEKPTIPRSSPPRLVVWECLLNCSHCLLLLPASAKFPKLPALMPDLHSLLLQSSFWPILSQLGCPKNLANVKPYALTLSQAVLCKSPGYTQPRAKASDLISFKLVHRQVPSLVSTLCKGSKLQPLLSQ